MGINVSTERPAVIEDSKYRYDSFKDGKVFDGKKDLVRAFKEVRGYN